MSDIVFDDQLFEQFFGEDADQSDEGDAGASASAASPRPIPPPNESSSQQGSQADAATPSPAAVAGPSTANAPATAPTTARPAELDETGWEMSIDLVPESIDKKLPSGTLFVGFSRMRSAMNSYSRRMAMRDWFDTCKVQTVFALARRFRQAGDKAIAQSHVDCKLAFRQLVERIGSLLNVHKCMRDWMAYQNDAMTRHIVKASKPLQKYFILLRID